MNANSPKNHRGLFANPAIPRVTLLIISGIFAWALLTLPISIRPDALPLQIGDVASVDIQAPRAITYTSQVLTENARIEAENRVSPVYLPADPSITRHQIERLRVTLLFINTVRIDSYATIEEKLSDLTKIQDIQLDPEISRLILGLNDNRWQTIQQEAISVLGQMMRNTIRSDQIDSVRRSVPTLISFNIPEDQSNIIISLVSGFITPNSLYSAEQTENARLIARESTSPIEKTLLAGETIAQRGQVITPEKWEALQILNLVQPDNNRNEMLGTTALIIVTTAFMGIYFKVRKPHPLARMKSLILIAFMFLVFLLSARLIIPNRTVLPYIFPLPAFALTIAVVYNLELSFILSIMLSVLSGYGLENSLDITIYYILMSLTGVLILGKGRRVASFFWSGVGIGVAGSLIILSYRLIQANMDLVGIATLVGSSFFNGLASGSLTLLLQFLFSQILGITTPLQLLDLSRPDHPLVQFLLRNAPGTYQHTLQVANLAEQAAERIGADALLVRVGAIFHDCGKANNPTFYIENQLPGRLDPHNELDPVVTARTVIQHVLDGVNLAKKYHLPPRIIDFILEHHGTLLTRYQYTQAVQGANNDPSKVDIELFRYPGPAPQSRETAILMLADGCEARARAELPKNEQELRKIIKSVIDFCEKEGQLDQTTLTLRDLSTITESFTATLQGFHHPRIVYPELKQVQSENKTNRRSSVTVITPQEEKSIQE